MNIAVCVREAPRRETRLGFDATLDHAERQPVPHEANPADLVALEAGAWLRQRLSGELILVSAGEGGPAAEGAIREALVHGGDRAVLVSDRTLRDADSGVVARVLGAALAKLDADVVLCGMATLDGGTGSVGARLADLMDRPYVGSVVGLEPANDGQTLLVERRLEQGRRETLACPIPTVLTVAPSFCELRYPSLVARRKAMLAPVEHWDIHRLGLRPEELALAATIRVMEVVSPRPRLRHVPTVDLLADAQHRLDQIVDGALPSRPAAPRMLEGSLDELVGKIVAALAEKRVLPERVCCVAPDSRA